MAPNANDLPRSVRQKILDQVRARVSPDEYDGLVGSLGEEGLINVLLQQIDAASTVGPEAKKKSGLWGWVRENWILITVSLVGGIIGSGLTDNEPGKPPSPAWSRVATGFIQGVAMTWTLVFVIGGWLLSAFIWVKDWVHWIADCMVPIPIFYSQERLNHDRAVCRGTLWCMLVFAVAIAVGICYLCRRFVGAG